MVGEAEVIDPQQLRARRRSVYQEAPESSAPRRPRERRWYDAWQKGRRHASIGHEVEPTEGHMAATVRGAIHELLEQTMATMDALLEASDRELAMSSSHACAQGKDVWTLITNDIDHEKIHTGQVLEGRYESRITASPMQRLVAEWLAERVRFIGSLIGLADEQFNSETAPGQWTYRVVAKHVLTLEQDSLKTIATDQAARTSSR
jgi:hypothetical protein